MSSCSNKDHHRCCADSKLLTFVNYCNCYPTEVCIIVEDFGCSEFGKILAVSGDIGELPCACRQLVKVGYPSRPGICCILANGYTYKSC